MEPNTSTDAGDLDVSNFGKPSFSLDRSVRTFSDNEIFLSPWTRYSPVIKTCVQRKNIKKFMLNIYHNLVPCLWASREGNGTPFQYFAWKISWMKEPGRLQSMGSLRVRHDWATSLSLFTFMHWRRKRQPTPVFLPGESQGRGSLVGCCLWGGTESDMTEAT